MDIMAWGTGDPTTREFHLLKDGERVAEFDVTQEDIKSLITELSEWVDGF